MTKVKQIIPFDYDRVLKPNFAMNADKVIKSRFGLVHSLLILMSFQFHKTFILQNPNPMVFLEASVQVLVYYTKPLPL